jgi:hypothetical protein
MEAASSASWSCVEGTLGLPMTLQVPEEHFLKASEALAFRALWNPASRLDFENFTKNNIF